MGSDGDMVTVGEGTIETFNGLVKHHSYMDEYVYNNICQRNDIVLYVQYTSYNNVFHTCMATQLQSCASSHVVANAD